MHILPQNDKVFYKDIYNHANRGKFYGNACKQNRG